MVFDEQGNLCDEFDVLATVREAHDLRELSHELFLSLGKNLPAFRDFCEIGGESSAGEYIIFKLKRRFGNYLYLFCEKNIVSGTVVNMVFPAEDQSDFYSFLSPSAHYFRSIADRIIYEILYIQNRHYYALTSVSPEAFLIISRAPFLAETILAGHVTRKFCHIAEVTERIFDCISAFPGLASTNIILDTAADTTNCLVKVPVEAYATVVQLATSLSAAMSDDHTVVAKLSWGEGHAELELSTVTGRINSAIDSSDLCAIENGTAPLGSYAKIASIISSIADIDTSVSFDPREKKLSLVISTGLEKLPLPDFKFSDPTENIGKICGEVQFLLEDLA